MRLCVFEDRAVARLQPLTLTRPAFDLRCGARSLLERQRRCFAAAEVGVLVRSGLAEMCRLAHPELAVNDPSGFRSGPMVLVNARWLPPVERIDDETPRVASVGGQVAYAILPHGLPGDCVPETIDQRLARWVTRLPQVPACGAMIDYPWDLIRHNEAALCEEPTLRQPGLAPRRPDVQVVGPEEQLFVDASAEVEPLVLADTRHGPVVIGREAQVKAFSRLEGPCYVGPGTWVLGAKVSGSSLGPVCRVGGEVEGSILHGHANKAHDGFLGHSYIGEWVNLGAGTQVSDLRNDYQPVRMVVAGQRVDTGLTKVGSFLGDHVKTGINTLLNTGTLVGAFSQVFAAAEYPPRTIPSFCSFLRGRLQPAPDLDRLLVTSATVMRRRGLDLTPSHAAFFRRLYEETAAERTRPVRAGKEGPVVPAAELQVFAERQRNGATW
jgi:UDP-N-acetylglucosamine diphosphorylase/glucosamine-1-phosphate N-acetyltransferase